MDKKYFLNRYESYRIEKLLYIIRHPAQYQPEAIEAAQELLAQRNPVLEEIEDLNRKAKAAEQEERFRIAEKRERRKKIVRELNLFRSELPLAVKLINGLGLYAILSGIADIYLLTGNEIMLAVYGWLVWVFILPMLLIAAGGVLLLLKKRTGWTIFFFIFTYSFFQSFAFAIITKSYLYFFDDLSRQFIPILFAVASVYTACRDDVRNFLGVTAKHLQLTLIASATLACIVSGILYVLLHV